MPKAISMHEVHSVQTILLSCAKTNTISKQTETSFHLTYITLEYHSGVPKAISMLAVHSRKPGTNLSPRLILSEYELEQASTRHTLPRYHSGVPKAISMHVVYSVQTVHLSCDEISTISKQIETSFILTTVS